MTTNAKCWKWKRQTQQHKKVPCIRFLDKCMVSTGNQNGEIACTIDEWQIIYGSSRRCTIHLLAYTHAICHSDGFQSHHRRQHIFIGKLDAIVLIYPANIDVYFG